MTIFKPLCLIILTTLHVEEVYKDRELLKKAYYNDRDYHKLKAEQDKQKEQRKAEQKRLDRLNYVPENNPIDKGITWVGKGIYTSFT